MSGESRPILALGPPEVGKRRPRPPAVPPTVVGPGYTRQFARLSPQFRTLAKAFSGKRASLAARQVDELDPELVLVFELAGTVDQFRLAVNRVPGLEFLAEMLDDEAEPDEDFHLERRDQGSLDDNLATSLYLVMSNAEAARQLVTLFKQSNEDPNYRFAYGLTKFRDVFKQLRNIRRWGAEDRVKDTGLIEYWREMLEVVGDSKSSHSVEIELWYRHDERGRAAAEAHVRQVVAEAQGEVRESAQIAAIEYHALLVNVPLSQVERVLAAGAGSIGLLAADEIMFVSPYRPMSFAPFGGDVPSSDSLPAPAIVAGLPRVALFDGLPFANHEALVGRLLIDDADEVGSGYPVASMVHGTAMASAIVHGDLADPGPALDRPLYVRPIMRPHEVIADREQVLADRLFTDLLHRSIRRLAEGDDGRPAVAPSVRIVNLSIGAEQRALVRRMSSLGRLLDWLSIEYNLLFVVSAGNHNQRIVVPASVLDDAGRLREEATRSARATGRVRGILPPGDAMNALTVGALHDDGSKDDDLPDTVVDAATRGLPALYGSVGPGVRRSVKPEILHRGGRALYARPVLRDGETEVELRLADTTATGPGVQVAAPGRSGATNAVAYVHGSSLASALVSREASRILDVLEAGRAEVDDPAFPDALYHPVLAKALVVHASAWGSAAGQLDRILKFESSTRRRELASMLGYGPLDPARLGAAATNRAIVIAGGAIGREQRHTFEVPLPPSLRTRAEWHRVTVTLAFWAPTSGQLTRYRGAKVFFERPDPAYTGGVGSQVEHYAVRRGSCQHEVFENRRTLGSGTNGALPIHVECMDDGKRLKAGETVRYGLVVSVEAAVETSTTIHDEVRAQLRARVRAQARGRVQG